MVPMSCMLAFSEIIAYFTVQWASYDLGAPENSDVDHERKYPAVSMCQALGEALCLKYRISSLKVTD